MHATVPHEPVELQVSTPLPEHCNAPGLQATQAPVRQAGVVPVHATAVPHEPVALHVWTPLPEHCLVPGVQATQAPLRQTEVVPLHVAAIPDS